MEQKINRIKELIRILNEASDAYYGGQEERLSNYEWDALFDELTALERETGVILPDSPTQNTSDSRDEEKSNGEKEPHEYPALSLAKSKDVAVLQAWAGQLPIWLSWKLDGLTLVVSYTDGVLTKILTRGNGIIGTNITFMKEAIVGIPLRIPYKGHLVVRGEATISYDDFEAINDTLEDADDKYANPRNLASGTLALDISNLNKVKERNVHFNAFTLVHTDEEIVSWGDRMDFLDRMGFTTVEREKTTAQGLPEVIEHWTRKVDSGAMRLPVDGLVICYDDTVYAATGSVTGHHATRAGFAYKWQDATAETTLDHIEWSCAASIITPVAVFDPVQLEGTTVSRASLCNISELERLGIGENRKTRLVVAKQNMIIPKCIRVESAEGHFEIPSACPVCGAPTEVRVSENSGTKTLRCTNPECPARHLKRFERFVSKTGMDVDGLSIQTLAAFVNAGFIKTYDDIYRLDGHKEEIQTMDGFGARSCENLLNAVEKSRNVNPENLIFALCIPLVGIDAGKKLIAKLGTKGFLQHVRTGQDYLNVEGIGAERSNSLVAWFADPENSRVFEALLRELHLKMVEPKAANDGTCAGLTFVITGEVSHFKNRDAFKAYVEAQGGKVAGSVSGKTAFLVNNDTTSTSAKNTKAKALGISILSEEDFIEKFGFPVAEQ